MASVIECPVCRIDTKKVELEPGLTIDKCVDCDGVWLDQGELARIGNVPEGVFRWEKALTSGSPTQMNCPVCKNTKLHAVKYAYKDSRLLIDLCQGCQGVWLDKNELPGFLEMLKKLRIEHKKS